MAETMRVMGATSDGVEMIEIPKPTPGRGEVRVKVVPSAVNAAEAKVIGGDIVGRFLHAKTSPLELGWDFAGTIDALGDGVTDIDRATAV
jgi:NADPH:quinone reductase-like Zn-dependent oxidoreductase